jgi:hypothetical protein
MGKLLSCLLPISILIQLSLSDRLLRINDLINSVLENYERLRRGGTAEPISLPTPVSIQQSSVSPTAISPTTNQKHGAINLIDFDDETIPDSSPYSLKNFAQPASQSAPVSSNVFGDMQGLDFFGATSGPSAVIAPNSTGTF